MTEAPKLSRLGRAAIAYAEMGWRVFTLQPRGKKPMGLCPTVGLDGKVCDARLPAKEKATDETTCKKCGTIHGKDEHLGLYLATNDVAVVTRWWTVEPKANIGVRTGDGLLFVDIDIPDADEGKTVDGEASLALLEAENDELPVTPRQRTGEKKQADGTMRRGLQYAFSVEGETRNSASKLGPGIDTRGDGGYVVAPPSVHPSGVTYEWEDGARPSQIPLAPAPAWLLAKLAETKKLSEVARAHAPPEQPANDIKEKWVQKAVDGEYERAAANTPGSRNHNLNTAAFKLGQLVGGSVLDRDTVLRTLTAAAEQSGWAKEEGSDAVEKVIMSGMDAGILQPRTIPDKGPYQAPGAKPQMRVAVDNTKPEPEKKKRTRKEDEETAKPAPLTGWTIEDWGDHCEFKPDSMILAPKVVRNAIAILMHRAEFSDLFRFNKRSQTIVVTRKPHWTANGNPYPRNMQDGDITGFQSAAEKLGLRLNQSGYAAAINFAARERDFDPVHDALVGFVWDGKARLDHWLVEYLGADDNTFTRQAGAKWMIAAVSRIIHPGAKFDYMLVLEGPQGIMKSSALRALADALGPDIFSDRLSPLKNKDSMIELMGKVIVEVAELAAFKGTDADSIKRFLSAQDDDLRLPWDRTTTRLLRGCVFAGTLNPDGAGWLDDPTGGRRFWPVPVTEVNLEGLREDAPQLWAEARARYEKGESTWLEDEIVSEMAHEAVMQRTSDDAWADKIDEFIAERDLVTTDAILGELGVQLDRRSRADVERIAKHMTKRGYKMKFPKIDGKTKRMWKSPKRKDLFTGEDEGE